MWRVWNPTRAGGNLNGTATPRVLARLELPGDPATPRLGPPPKTVKTCSHKDLHVHAHSGVT